VVIEFDGTHRSKNYHLTMYKIHLPRNLQGCIMSCVFDDMELSITRFIIYYGFFSHAEPNFGIYNI